MPALTVDWQEQVDSTNDRALWLAGHRELLQLPLLVLADSQTAGRGQKTNTWWSSPGALTFSLVVDASMLGLTPDLWPQASLTTGLAICEALDELLEEITLQIKWPNDVYADGKKICGILLESPDLREGTLVLGVGINVNNSLADAPSEIAGFATSMSDTANRRFDLVGVLIDVLARLFNYLELVGARDPHLYELWRKRCFLTQKRVAVHAATEIYEGMCQGIGDDGALQIQTQQGLQRCLAGTVQLLDP